MKTPLFITATGQSVGKTIVTLGMMQELTRALRVGFIKPVGLARVRAGRDGIDLDALLIEKTCKLHENIKDMCPVTLSRTDWPEVTEDDANRMMARIHESYQRVCTNRELMVVEGSGNPALGNVLGISNARVAKELGCRALLVAAYGTLQDNPFDTIESSRSYFASHGVDTIGVLLNRVPQEHLEAYSSYAASRLERIGVPLYGLLPESEQLKTFRFLQVTEYLEGEMLCGSSHAEKVIDQVRVGAMTPHRALEYFRPRSLIITPGDREDIIVTACACAQRSAGGPAGLVLSGGQRPHQSIVELLEEARLPVFLAEEDSYHVASKIHDMPLRIQPTDAEKITKVQQLVMDHVDVESIVGSL